VVPEYSSPLIVLHFSNLPGLAPDMLKWLVILAHTGRSALKSRQDLAIENIALRPQVVSLKHKCPRPQLTNTDRLFWILISRLWPAWRSALHVAQPATVVPWQRQGFRYFWRWKGRRRGRPKIDPQIRQLIQRMC